MKQSAASPGANIESFGDALWGSASTVTPVGYGDQFPVAASRRMVAIALMLRSIVLIGVVTATFASWLLDKVKEVEESTPAASWRDIQELTREVAELRAALSLPQVSPAGYGPGG